MVKANFLFLAIIFSFASCNDSGFQSGGVKRQTAEQRPAITALTVESFELAGEQIESGVVDVVFVVDTSGSMDQEQVLLEQNLGSFLQEFKSKNVDVDYQIHLIGTGFNFPNLDPKVSIVAQMVNSNDALAVLYNYIHNGINGQSVRKGSTVEAVIITDDNAKAGDDIPPISIMPYPNILPEPQNSFSSDIRSLDAKQFSDLLMTNHPELDLHMNGLVGKRDGEVNDWCHISETGTEYESLAAMTRFRGLMADLCTDDWSPLLGELAANIIKRIDQAKISLQLNPDLSRGYSVKFNGQPVDRSKILIMEDGSVTITDSELQRQAGKLEISYVPRR